MSILHVSMLILLCLIGREGRGSHPTFLVSCLSYIYLYVDVVMSHQQHIDKSNVRLYILSVVKKKVAGLPLQILNVSGGQPAWHFFSPEKRRML